MTPHELKLHLDVFNERMKNEADANVLNAYLSAYYNRVKKMPDIKTIIKEPKKPQKKQTDKQMLEQVLRLHKEEG